MLNSNSVHVAIYNFVMDHCVHFSRLGYTPEQTQHIPVPFQARNSTIQQHSLTSYFSQRGEVFMNTQWVKYYASHKFEI